jgi:hypothetical protein
LFSSARNASSNRATSSGRCSCGASVRRRVGDAPRRRYVALVARARDGEQRQLEANELVPNRLEHALAGGPKEHGERLRPLRESPRPLRLDQGLRLVREQRLALPHSDDVLDRRRLHPSREPVVGLGARVAQRRLVDPGGCSDRDDPEIALRVAQCRPQREPPSE